MNAAELAALADRLAEHAPPGTPERDFARAVARWLQGEEDTLDAALGLSAHRGQDSAPRRWRRDQRNRHLTTALELVEGDTTGARCRALAAEIARFESRIWPRWRVLTAPPPEASRLRTALFKARQFGCLPTTHEQLRNIARETGSSF
ncbi:hypothetical protein HW932_15355 [Allochromatium humboldtianum]|uniref:Uncharacterized protein n=1 Tax=Allochromatium humboldtianum TaxID=504901 RepID=A0A850R7G3_9GAMM|nr:hypothetical protein [Allochromatium humboldtianum]NVZ10639.1 hypothetical protein [Allochromatium humboldtianum]